jgi:hypothetical protein
MLWAYFDESGWHAKPSEGGGLKKLTVGGCVATFESWECLSAEWASAIAAMGIPCFHMKDFEARRPPYDVWSNDQRKDRLNILLGILGAKGRHCYGFTNYARPGDTTSSIYERCAHDLLLELGTMYDDEFAIVFSHHPEFGRHTELLDLLLKHGMGKQIRSLTVAMPIDTCPLQAADIIAYEIRAEEREESVSMRYPLRRIQELGATFRFSGSAD